MRIFKIRFLGCCVLKTETYLVDKMRLSNKKRLLSIICANLLFLGNSLALLNNYQDFPDENDVIGDLVFNQTEVPENMEDCKFTNENQIDVICDGSKWTSIIKSQFPRKLRSLKIHDFAGEDLKIEDFCEKEIYSLEIFNSETFAKIQNDALSPLNSTLRFLRITNTSLNVKNQTVFGHFLKYNYN